MRILFTTWEGGGHVPPALLVAQRLRQGGAQVLFVSDEANRVAARAHGLEFESWRRAPNRHSLGSASDRLRDWRARTPPGVVKAICDGVMCKPAGDYAQDTLELIARFRPDVIVSNELLFGVIAAAEATGVPLSLLTGNIWCFPTRADVPPFGPGFAPARGQFGEGRDRTVRALVGMMFNQGLRDLNRGRASVGLKPLRRVLDQLDPAETILLGAAQSFDFGADPPPPRFVYAGPLIRQPEWVATAPSPPLSDKPLVLVSFSTAFQDHGKLVRRCVRALEAMPVQGVVTLGPAIDPADVPGAPNVEVFESASHDELAPRCAAIICHAGHGTAVRPLMHGVPLLCLPTGRDQLDNAARIVARGAGLRLSPRAGAHRIRRALGRILSDPRFREAASTLGQSIRAETDGGVRAAASIRGLAREG